jgi:hypothetical protein
MDTKDKEGTCELCSTTYVKERYWYEHDPYGEGYELQPCPQCMYDPNLASSIAYILERHTHLTLHCSPRDYHVHAEANVAELTDLIITAVKKSWPTYKNKIGGFQT